VFAANRLHCFGSFVDHQSAPLRGRFEAAALRRAPSPQHRTTPENRSSSPLSSKSIIDPAVPVSLNQQPEAMPNDMLRHRLSFAANRVPSGSGFAANDGFNRSLITILAFAVGHAYRAPHDFPRVGFGVFLARRRTTPCGRAGPVRISRLKSRSKRLSSFKKWG
jgi:hypothetical protein